MGLSRPVSPVFDPRSRGTHRGCGRATVYLLAASRSPGSASPPDGERSHQSPLTFTIWRRVCRTSTRSAASRHDDVDVLVGGGVSRRGTRRSAPTRCRRMRASRSARVNGPPCRRPRWLRPGAVRGGVQRQRVAHAARRRRIAAPIDPGIRPRCPALRVDRALAGQPHVLAEVRLARGVVVVAVDLARARGVTSAPMWSARQAATRSIISSRLRQREPLRPAQRARCSRRTPASPRRGRRGRGRAGRCHVARSSWAILMCFERACCRRRGEPECRNSQTRSSSSRVTSMKWLPEPRRAQLQRPVRRRRRRPWSARPAARRPAPSTRAARRALSGQASVVLARPTAGRRARCRRAAARGRPAARTSAAVHGCGRRSSRSRCRRRPRPG